LITVAIGQVSELLEFGLMAALEHDSSITVVGAGLTEDALARIIAEQNLSVAILGETGARALLARLNALRSPTVAFVLARDPPRYFGLDLLASGASCLADSTSAEELRAAVHLAARGVRLFATPHERTEREWDATEVVLTQREEQVLKLTGEDKRPADIATELGISVETVHKHLTNIKRKLGAGLRQDLVRIDRPTPGRSGSRHGD
jgi:DNA-binding NarL/FixJ family response regulator